MTNKIFIFFILVDGYTLNSLWFKVLGTKYHFFCLCDKGTHFFFAVQCRIVIISDMLCSSLIHDLHSFTAKSAKSAFSGILRVAEIPE